MKSMQKYFDYEMGICGCGIKALEMCGNENDWKNLGEKLSKLKKVLAPIESTLLLNDYFTFCEKIFENLLKTFQGDKEMAKWWSTVLIEAKDYEYGPSGMRKTEVDAYNGWLVQFCTNKTYPLKAKELKEGKCTELSCLSSCPMKIVDRINNVEDKSTLFAGVLGFQKHENSQNGIPSLQPVHGWVMMLPPNSPLRSEH